MRDLPEPDEVAVLIREHLQSAMEEMDALTALLPLNRIQ